MIGKNFILSFALVAFASPSIAQNGVNTGALTIVAEFAERICGKYSSEGSSSNKELSIEAKADLASVFKKLADLGLTGAAKYADSNYSNVRQEQLLDAIKSGQACRTKIWDDFRSSVIGAQQSGSTTYIQFRSEKIIASCHYGDNNSSNNNCPSELALYTYKAPPDFAVYQISGPRIDKLTPQGDTKTRIVVGDCRFIDELFLTSEQVARLSPEARSLYESKQLYRGVQSRLQTTVVGNYHDGRASLECEGWIIPLYKR